MSNKILLLLIILFSLALNCMPQNKNKTVHSDTSLNYIVRENKDKNVSSPLLILLHGHGSNENDLFSFNTHIPDNWIVVSVRAPYKLNEESYCWYDVKMINQKININIEEEEKSRKKLLQLIETLTKKYKVNPHKTIVAGFSQGANMAQSIGLSEPNLVAGFGVFSGRFVEEFIPYINPSPTLKNSRAFISHGSSDNMLPKTYAEENITKLKTLGIQTTYCEDTNAHAISTKQLNAFGKWLLNYK